MTRREQNGWNDLVSQHWMPWREMRFQNRSKSRIDVQPHKRIFDYLTKGGSAERIDAHALNKATLQQNKAHSEVRSTIDLSPG
mmetsp:Transcript_5876/g.9766  ORF Transcript_5876/g.9766 Transcript_5876/m.9766 type:complete len:83 (+) Transcript_5876:250-498(+)